MKVTIECTIDGHGIELTLDELIAYANNETVRLGLAQKRIRDLERTVREWDDIIEAIEGRRGTLKSLLRESDNRIAELEKTIEIQKKYHEKFAVTANNSWEVKETRIVALEGLVPGLVEFGRRALDIAKLHQEDEYDSQTIIGLSKALADARRAMEDTK